ncbi:MAG TPA: catalase [Candidatus Acidoferrales bacterium]|jgi:catalase|nr:catalase [Candidatus Acidoferrales bacterium]
MKREKPIKAQVRQTEPKQVKADGGETHQQAPLSQTPLTTNQGLPISDNQNSLRAGERGPTLLEDFILREKITHFDHERTPERIVHARGAGAHGYFQPYHSMKKFTKAAFLADPSVKTPVFVRFSTVAGERGSTDLARDVRGFAVKFYTSEGNFDLVGNNIPVFFIQDAMKFPDLIHSVKIEPDRGFPQAASAHDTFWDFISLMPESMHMIMWVMSDRAIPRSFRMMEGFGVHTFRLVNEAGKTHFVKFHWRPVLGTSSVLWDEAVKISGADPDFHRRDLWEAIASGDFPEFELGLQIFDEETAARFPFDVLDATKLIPEEFVPLQMVGKMILDRNPDNFFAETEQVAFCPSHLVPGLDFSEDPLLQGRLFSYLDTQLSRLGGPNFHQIPVNAPKCPFHNLQRDGIHQVSAQAGRVAYEPNSLSADAPRESMERGFTTSTRSVEGNAVRVRSESFSDHYSQARLFYRSITPPEQKHLANALTFELGKLETVAIRLRMLGHLSLIDRGLADKVSAALGADGQGDQVTAAKNPVDLEPSPALRLYGKFKPTLKGRKVGLLLGAGFDDKFKKELVSAIKDEGAKVAVLASKIQGEFDSDKRLHRADMALRASPSVLFDAVVALSGPEGDKKLAGDPNAVSFLTDAKRHCKAVGLSGIPSLAKESGVEEEPGVIYITGKTGVKDFISASRIGRFWERETE